LNYYLLEELERYLRDPSKLNDLDKDFHRTMVVWDKADGHCEYCGKDLSATNEDYFRGSQIDHVISASKGGTEDLENLALACSYCNLSKGHYVPIGSTREERIANVKEHLLKLNTRNTERRLKSLEVFKEYRKRTIAGRP